MISSSLILISNSDCSSELQTCVYNYLSLSPLECTESISTFLETVSKTVLPVLCSPTLPIWVNISAFTSLLMQVTHYSFPLPRWPSSGAIDFDPRYIIISNIFCCLYYIFCSKHLKHPFIWFFSPLMFPVFYKVEPESSFWILLVDAGYVQNHPVPSHGLNPQFLTPSINCSVMWPLPTTPTTLTTITTTGLLLPVS